MSFENLNCCFQKDCKITVLNFKNKIFIFNLKVKLEKESNQSSFHTEKENLHVTASQNTVHATPSSSAFSSATSRLSSQGLPSAGRGKGRGQTGSSVPRPHGPLAYLLPKFRWP